MTFVREKKSGKKAKKLEFQKRGVSEQGYKVEEASAEDIKKRREEWEKGNIKSPMAQKKPVEELGYRVEEANAEELKKRRDEWEKGKKLSEVQKKPVEDMGYRVEEASPDDIKRRKNEWEKGQLSVQSPTQKKTNAGDLGYKVQEASPEDIKRRKEEWEKGKGVPAGLSSSRTPGEVGYQVETEGVKNRLERWTSLNNNKPGTPERKQPIKIPTENSTLADQTDVKTVKYADE